jgi:uncharacterized metal-binding protein YceD (DUF177 family)
VIEPQPELSRPIEISRIPPTGSTETIIAEPKEREPIARRLGLPAVHALKADLALSRWRGEGVKVTGRVAAEVEQICVVTLDPFRAEVTDTVERYFLPGADSANEEANVDSFDNGIIELGEVVVESLSLALDPYPRKPGAEFHVAGDDATAAAGEATPSPFAALSGLEPRKR